MQSNIVNVFAKELKMFARDVKTLFTTVLTPLLLIPIMLLITTSSTQALQESELRVAFSHGGNIVSKYISLIDNVKVIKTDNVEKDLQSGRLSAYIDIPENADELFMGDEQLPINVTYNESLTESQIAMTQKQKNYLVKKDITIIYRIIGYSQLFTCFFAAFFSASFIASSLYSRS